jgi:hypothetical protein
MEKVTGLFAGVTVSRDPKHAGVLVLRSPLGTGRFVAAGQDLFRQVDGNERIAFQRDARGRVTHFFIDSVPMMAMERLAWYQAPWFHQTLLAVALLVLLTMPFVMLGSWLLHRRFRELSSPTRGERLARWAALLAICLAVGFGIGLVAVASNPNDLIAGHTAGLNVLLTLPVLLAVSAIALIGCALLAWQREWWGRWGRVHYTAVAVATAVLVAVLAYWNLLGWSY